MSTVEMDEADSDVCIMPVLSGERFANAVQYPIIVEQWDKRLAGRVKREWLETFTEAERKAISRYYPKFYRWYLVTGNPDRVVIRLSTIRLLQRAVGFFATI